MKYNRNTEVINRRCEKLQELGFEIYHEDSRVSVFKDIVDDVDVVVDFSAIAEEHFSRYALMKTLEFGITMGRNSLQKDIKALLGY